MSTTTTTRYGLGKVDDGTEENTWGTIERAARDAIDKALGGGTSINVTTAATTTLSVANAAAKRLIFTGSATADMTILLPAVEHFGVADFQGTLGTHTANFKPAGTSGAGFALGTQPTLYVSDGTTVEKVASGVVWPETAVDYLDMDDNEIRKPLLRDVGEQVVDLGTVGSGTATCNIESANVFKIEASGNFTFAFANPTASGDACTIAIFITNGGAHTITYPAAVSWSGGGAPTLPSSGDALLAFTTLDGGSSLWMGRASWVGT